MTRRVRFITAAAVLALLALPATSQAQGAFLWAGAGLAIPMGDYGDATDAGWLGTAGVGVNVGDSGFGVFGEGMYGQNSLTSTSPGLDDGNVKVFGAMAGVIYRAGDPSTVGPYAFGGGGLLVVDVVDLDSESNFGFEFGVGLDVPLGGNFGVWIEGRYLGSTGDTDVDIIGILAGVGVGLGG